MIYKCDHFKFESTIYCKSTNDLKLRLPRATVMLVYETSRIMNDVLYSMY